MAFDFKKLLGNVLPVLGAVTGNPLLAAAGGAAGGAMTGGGKGALVGGATGGLGSFFGGKLFGTGNGFNPLKLFGGGGGGMPPTGGANSFNLGHLTAGGPNSAGAGIFKNLTQQSSKGGFLSNPLALGAGIMGASQLIRSPKVPELPQSVIDFQNAARQGNPLQNQASVALQQQLQQTQQNASEDEINALNRQYDLAQEQELKSVDAMYKSLRPGSDPLTDTSYQKDLGTVRDRYATLRADSLAQMQRQISNDFTSQRAQQIAQASGLGEQQLQQLAQLSQYDLDRVMDQMAISYNDRNTLRNYLLQLGGNVAASGFQKNPLYASPYGG